MQYARFVPFRALGARCALRHLQQPPVSVAAMATELKHLGFVPKYSAAGLEAVTQSKRRAPGAVVRAPPAFAAR